ncbi:MAG: alpha-hydroxy-acid oxidizing protein [Spirochaetes bacterium]|nr:alpha-hydroxy-acid oxidizing protein [Spirochaetota bacterium]
MRKYIVSIGGGILQERIIREINELGFESIVFDKDPDCIGSRIANLFFPISTRDYEAIIEKLKSENLLDKTICAITVGTDMSYTVAKINEIVAPYLVSTDTALKTTDKSLMRQTLKDSSIKVPEFYLCSNINEVKEAFSILSSKKKEVVIKPVDNMGARGVRKVLSLDELEEAFTEAISYSIKSRVLVEEFIEGDELSVDALVYKGEVMITGIADRIIEYPPYFVETGHIMPTNLPKEVVDLALFEFKKAIKAVGIGNGCAKGDIKISKDGNAYIGEIASRLSGGFMSTHTFPYSTGINLMKNALLIHLGKEPEIGNYEYKYVAVERAIIPYKGIVTKILGVDEALQLEGVKDVIIKVKEGDIIREPKSNLDKAGNVIAVGRNREEAIRNVNNAIRRIKISTEVSSEIRVISEEDVLKIAKERFNGSCYVCRECNGEACRGRMPGIGGVGTGQTFVENVKALKRYKILPRYIYTNSFEIDTSVDFLGIRLSLPIVVSPVTGTKTNLGGVVDELDYLRWVIKGAMYSGTIAMVGDSATPDKYKVGIRAMLENFGNGIGIYKPRKDNNEIIKRIREAENAGAIAVGMDIDGISIITMKLKNQEVSPKGLDELKYIISSTKLPFVVKGVMTPEDAILAYEAGARVIMVSNHGGRVNDSLPSTIDVLPSIVEVLKDKDVIIGIDGGFRSGADVVKALCVGAHFVGIGRPITIYAFGGGVDGVKNYFDKIKNEMKETMKILGVRSIKELKPGLIFRSSVV